MRWLCAPWIMISSQAESLESPHNHDHHPRSDVTKTQCASKLSKVLVYQPAKVSQSISSPQTPSWPPLRVLLYQPLFESRLHTIAASSALGAEIAAEIVRFDESRYVHLVSRPEVSRARWPRVSRGICTWGSDHSVGEIQTFDPCLTNFVGKSLEQIGVVTACGIQIGDYGDNLGAIEYSSESVNFADTGGRFALKLHRQSAMDNGIIRWREAHGPLFKWIGYHAPAISTIRHAG